MENSNDPRNIIGMADILADDDEDLDIADLEKSIINGISIGKKDDKPIDIAKEYDKELEQLSRQFNIGNFNNKAPDLDDNDDLDDNISSWSPYKSSSGSVPNKEKPSVSFSLDDEDGDGGADADDDDAGADDDNNRDNRSESKGIHSSWSANRPIDAHLGQMTNEERKQKHINNVLNNIEKNDDDSSFIKEEEEEDEMAKIMEQIDLLKSNLESEGVDLSRIQEVNHSTSRKEAKAVLRILQIKNDRLRYCDMFEEGILACAYGLESVFDGKKVWFGSQVDLTGWSDTVKVKLRRMRYDTSTFVSEIVRGYNIGSGWRILFELLPSLFLYSRDRRLKSNDTLWSDDKYKDAIRELGH